MAMYVRAVKIAEDDASVTYRWGKHYEAEDGTFTIPKLPPEQIISSGIKAKDYGLNFYSAPVFMKIIRYYEKNGTFPDTMSFQS
ncbi:MAG: hypothetical protein IK134_06505 [Oscillospiraceae bacterium]|nr:hypothetical protein [Oscillospiraceae bacterium]